MNYYDVSIVVTVLAEDKLDAMSRVDTLVLPWVNSNVPASWTIPTHSVHRTKWDERDR